MSCLPQTNGGLLHWGQGCSALKSDVHNHRQIVEKSVTGAGCDDFRVVGAGEEW